MNFTQMHERLRLELLRRIQRGTLSVSLLARQTGFGQPHLSNFLRSRRLLSLDAMDRILAAQRLTVADLLPATPQAMSLGDEGEQETVAIVSHTSALFEPIIRPSAVQGALYLPGGVFQPVRARATASRRSWQRFVAVRIPGGDAQAMDPLIMPEALVLLDRHYNSLIGYRPDRPNLYAIRHGTRLSIRYADFASDRLVLRPHSIAHPVELIEIAPGDTPSDLLCGRVVLILNEY